MCYGLSRVPDPELFGWWLPAKALPHLTPQGLAREIRNYAEGHVWTVAGMTSLGEVDGVDVLFM